MFMKNLTTDEVPRPILFFLLILYLTAISLFVLSPKEVESEPDTYIILPKRVHAEEIQEKLPPTKKELIQAILDASRAKGVSGHSIVRTIGCESNFQSIQSQHPQRLRLPEWYVLQGDPKLEQSFGISQIHLPSNKEVTYVHTEYKSLIQSMQSAQPPVPTPTSASKMSEINSKK